MKLFAVLTVSVCLVIAFVCLSMSLWMFKDDEDEATSPRASCARKESK